MEFCAPSTYMLVARGEGENLLDHCDAAGFVGYTPMLTRGRVCHKNTPAPSASLRAGWATRQARADALAEKRVGGTGVSFHSGAPVVMIRPMGDVNAHPFSHRTVRRRLQVFLCHASSDKPAVRELHKKLQTDGYRAWLDEEDLLPGQEWQREIPNAVKSSDVVIVCLSRQSITKTGYVQKEIKYALDAADEQPEGKTFLIPLRLELCEVPQRLSRWQWVDLFEAQGYQKLVRALNACFPSLSESAVAAGEPSQGDESTATDRSRRGYNPYPFDVVSLSRHLSPEAEGLLIETAGDSSQVIAADYDETGKQAMLRGLKAGGLQVQFSDSPAEAERWQQIVDALQRSNLIRHVASRPGYRAYKLTRDGWEVAEFLRKRRSGT